MSSATFFYRVFDLVVESQYECPELLSDIGLSVPDIQICQGIVPDHLDNAVTLGSWIEGNPQQILLNISGVARFLIANAREITVHPDENAVSDNIRLYLLGSAMGALLHQRGILPFHGSSVAYDGQAITFSGPSGIGKSTLAGALVARGYRMLADDISAMSFYENGSPLVNPGMPQLKLHSDAIQQLGYDLSLARPLGNHAGKYGYPEHTAFVSNSLPSKTIYILGRHTENRFEDIVLKGMDKFHALQVNVYRPSFVKAMGIERRHFDMLRKLAWQVDVHLLLRPAEDFRIDELADLVSHWITK